MNEQTDNQHESAAHEPIEGYYPSSFGPPCFESDGLMPILRPLARLLAEECITEKLEEILPYFNLLGNEHKQEPHSGHLLLDLRPVNIVRCTKYLWALLRKAESCNAWEAFQYLAEWDAEFEYSSPIRFSVIKLVGAPCNTVFAQHYLVAECYDESFDREAAERQVNLLVEFLSDEANVPEITAEQRAMLI